MSDMAKALDDAMTTSQGGLKVIIADGECQLERQRRIRPIAAKRLKDGKRVVRTRFGIDDNMCTGGPFLHPDVWMSVADDQAQSQHAAYGSRGNLYRASSTH